MSSLIPFSFESHSVRAFNIDGTPWFVGKDVAEALGYKNPADAIIRHCRGVAKHYPIVDSLGRTQDIRVINEPDTFRLIVGSNLPEAERFERWLFEEVLPAIRQTGRYEAPNFRDPLSDFGPKAQFAVLEMLVGKVAKEIADGFIGYLRTQPGRFTPEPAYPPAQPAQERPKQPRQQPAVHDLSNARQRVLAFIAARKGQGAGTSTLYRLCSAYRNLPDDKRKELIRQLLSAGEIVEVTPESQPGARRKAVIYVAKAFAGVVQ